MPWGVTIATNQQNHPRNRYSDLLSVIRVDCCLFVTFRQVTENSYCYLNIISPTLSWINYFVSSNTCRVNHVPYADGLRRGG